MTYALFMDKLRTQVRSTIDKMRITIPGGRLNIDGRKEFIEGAIRELGCDGSGEAAVEYEVVVRQALSWYDRNGGGRNLEELPEEAICDYPYSISRLGSSRTANIENLALTLIFETVEKGERISDFMERLESEMGLPDYVHEVCKDDERFFEIFGEGIERLLEEIRDGR